MKQKMPRSQSSKLRWLAVSASFSALVLFVLIIGVHAGPQQKTAQTGNPNSQARTGQRKSLTPLKGSDSSDGSRVTITSDAPLNDYSAYRNGDRFYVVIPESDVPHAQSGMRGRGYEDVQVQKRGGDTVLSFRLQRGASARVNQKFNKLDIVISTPAGSSNAAQNNTNPAGTNPAAGTQTTNSRLPQSPQAPNVNGKAASSVPFRAEQGTSTSQTGNDSNRKDSAQVSVPDSEKVLTEASPSPNASQGGTQAGTVPETAVPSPSQGESAGSSPASENTATTPADSNSRTSVVSGVTQFAGRNWRWLVAAALLLLALSLLLLRGRKREIVSAKAAENKIVQRDPRPVPSSSPVTTSSPTGAVVYPNSQAAVLVEAVAKRDFIDSKAAETAAPVLAAAPSSQLPMPAPVKVERVPAAPALPLHFERAEEEVRHLLTGNEYDTSIVDSRDPGMRQFVATELLSAMGGRNAVRRDLALAAFIHHGYFDEATRSLRVADAQAERASAARALGLTRETAATPHLIGALEDSSPDVRRAAVEALAEIKDPSAAEPLSHLLQRERDRKVPRPLIQRAIDASSNLHVAEIAPAPSLEEEVLPDIPGATSVQESVAKPYAEDLDNVLQQDESEVFELTESIPARSQVVEPVSANRNSSAAVEASKQSQVVSLHTEATSVAPVSAGGIVGLNALDNGPGPSDSAGVASIAEFTSARDIYPEEQIEAEKPVEVATEARDFVGHEVPVDEQPFAGFDIVTTPLEAAPSAASTETEPSVANQAEAESFEFEWSHPIDMPVQEKTSESFDLSTGQLQVAKSAEPVTPLVEKHEVIENVNNDYSTISLDQVPLVSADEFLRQASGNTANEWVDVDVNDTGSDLDYFEIAEPALDVTAAVEPEEEPLPEFTFDEVETIDAEAIPVTAIEQYQEEVSTSNEILDVAEISSIEQWSDEPANALDKEIVPFEPAAALELEKEIVPFESAATLEKEIVPVEPVPVLESSRSKLFGEDPADRAAALIDLGRTEGESAFHEICQAFDDPAQEVRNAAAQTLYELNPDRAGSFTRALREATFDRRRRIGNALASSGLAAEAIGHLSGEGREKTYDAFSLLFLMSKAGEVQPLVRAIEDHPNSEVRLAVVKLLALSGQQEILPYFRRLAVRGSLPSEVRSAVMEAIYQISNQSAADAHTAA
jgi:hypothetical protein